MSASVEIVDDEGKKVRVYKRDDNLTPDDCKTTAAYNDTLGRYHLKMAIYYAKKFEEKTGKQMLLSFEPENFID